MPSLKVEDNIKKIEQAIEELTQEVFRLQGSLRVFKGFKEAGLTEVDIPEQPQDPDVATEESTQK